MAIQVRAKERGYYKQLREEGDVFLIDKKEEFSEVWMERLGAKSAKRPRRRAAPPPEVGEEETGGDEEPPEVSEDS